MRGYRSVVPPAALRRPEVVIGSARGVPLFTDDLGSLRRLAMLVRYGVGRGGQNLGKSFQQQKRTLFIDVGGTLQGSDTKYPSNQSSSYNLSKLYKKKVKSIAGPAGNTLDAFRHLAAGSGQKENLGFKLLQQLLYGAQQNPHLLFDFYKEVFQGANIADRIDIIHDEIARARAGGDKELILSAGSRGNLTLLGALNRLEEYPLIHPETGELLADPGEVLAQLAILHDIVPVTPETGRADIQLGRGKKIIPSDYNLTIPKNVSNVIAFRSQDPREVMTKPNLILSDPTKQNLKQLIIPGTLHKQVVGTGTVHPAYKDFLNLFVLNYIKEHNLSIAESFDYSNVDALARSAVDIESQKPISPNVGERLSSRIFSFPKDAPRYIEQPEHLEEFYKALEKIKASINRQ
jgi:hypothetical protein